jgi:hypothetical protein
MVAFIRVLTLLRSPLILKSMNVPCRIASGFWYHHPSDGFTSPYPVGSQSAVYSLLHRVGLALQFADAPVAGGCHVDLRGPVEGSDLDVENAREGIAIFRCVNRVDFAMPGKERQADLHVGGFANGTHHGFRLH